MTGEATSPSGQGGGKGEWEVQSMRGAKRSHAAPDKLMRSEWRGSRGPTGRGKSFGFYSQCSEQPLKGLRNEDHPGGRLARRLCQVSLREEQCPRTERRPWSEREVTEEVEGLEMYCGDSSVLETEETGNLHL